MENNNQAFHRILKEFVQVFVLASLVLGTVYFYGGFDQSSTRKYSCDGETIVRDFTIPVFKGKGGSLFSGGKNKSYAYAHSGQQCILLTPEEPFGFEYTVEDLKGNEAIEVVVWRMCENPKDPKGMLVAHVEGGGIWEGNYNRVEATENGWEKLVIRTQTDARSTNKKLTVYCWNNGDTPVYFDDISIRLKQL